MTTPLPLLSRLLHRASRTGAACGLGMALASTAATERPPAQDFLVHNWDVDEGLPSTCVNAVVRTPDGYVWLGTRHGLARFDGVRFVIFNYDNTPALKDNRMISLAADPQGVLWIGTENGNLTRYEQGEFAAEDLGNATRQNSIISMVADAGGNLWLGNGWRRIDSIERRRGGNLHHHQRPALAEYFESAGRFARADLVSDRSGQTGLD